MERCWSGLSGAPGERVSDFPTVGSNPTLSARKANEDEKQKNNTTDRASFTPNKKDPGKYLRRNACGSNSLRFFRQKYSTKDSDISPH